MLHATFRKKTRFFERYMFVAPDESVHREQRVCAEDEITSTIFGTLAFLPCEQRAHFCRVLLQRQGLHGFLPEAAPTACGIELWPVGGACEPDVVIDLEWHPLAVSRRLIFELKWRSGLSGEDQLRRQWQEYAIAPGRSAESVHVYLALNARGVAGGRGSPDGRNPHRLIPLDWRSMSNLLESFMGDEARAELATWAKLARGFLRRSGVRTFHGFEHVCPASGPVTFQRFFNGEMRFFDGVPTTPRLTHRSFFHSTT